MFNPELPTTEPIEQSDNEQKEQSVEIVRGTFEDFWKFNTKLQEKYPDRDWVSDFALSMISQSNASEVYLAQLNGEVVGALLGELQPHFHGHFLQVDLEYQNQGVAKDLLQQAMKEHGHFSLIAVPYGLPEDMTYEEEMKREAALIRYYKSLGFKPELGKPGDHLTWKNEEDGATPS